MNKQDDVKPFELLFSNEQQKFLKHTKTTLQDFLDAAQLDEDSTSDEKKTYYIIQGIFTMPVVDQNLFLIKTYGEYKSTTELANELHVTKQTMCARMRKIKKYIKQYVNEKIYKEII